jgi:hypothetical protein
MIIRIWNKNWGAFMTYTKKLFAYAAVSAALMSATAANAAIVPVTVGNLSSDSSTKITTDTKTGRQYTRFDAFNLTYADTLKAIASGGTWAGWSIVTADVSRSFIASVLAPASSNCNLYGQTCGYAANWTDGKLGNAYDSDRDYYAYIDKNGLAGIVDLYKNGAVSDYDYGDPLARFDNFKDPSFRINYMLYRDAPTSAIPEPASLALVGLGLASFAAARRRKS